MRILTHTFIQLIKNFFLYNAFCTSFVKFFFFFWLHWVFIAACGLSLVVASGGFSCCGARALGAQASVVAAHGLSSCSPWALWYASFGSCGVWAQYLWLMVSRAQAQ